MLPLLVLFYLTEGRFCIIMYEYHYGHCGLFFGNPRLPRKQDRMT